MGVLSSLEPNKVFKYFEEICSIPHGSANVEKISNYLVDFAKERGLKYRQDEKLNVVIWKDATPGFEDSETVIMQGHMDMVAVKVDGCDKNLEEEGLDLEINGDLISAKGTSLGGDDGIAVAYALAILDDDSIPHPPIEVVVTTDEEIGMFGATALDCSDLKGRIFMNCDSEDEGVFTVSCAGGVTASCRIPYKKESVEATAVEIKMSGFTGGHSGVEINKGRLNANVVLGRILLNVAKNTEMKIVSVNGGEKDNAITTFADAVIAVETKDADCVKKIIEDTFNEVKDEHKTTDPDMKITVNALAESTIEAFDKASTNAAVTMLVNLPNGIQRMNPEMEDMVQTSLNMGILKTLDDVVEMSFAVRSSVESEKRFLVEKLKSLTEVFGGEVVLSGDYPGWEYKKDSRLRDVMIEAYKSLYDGKEPIVEGIHAGLECGIFASKLPGLDAISFGPQMKDIHTTNEVLSISSTQRTWDLVCKTLEMLK